MKVPWRWHLAGMFLSLVHLPAAAQVDSAYDRAVAARLAGNPIEAAELLRSWLRDNPNDVDALLQLALAHLAMGNLDEAEARFQAVLALAPDYRDAQEGMARVAARRRESSSTSIELAADAGLGFVTGPGRDWFDTGGRLIFRTDPATTVTAQGTYYRRFGQQDLELAVGLVRRVGTNLWLRADTGISPSADFRPEWQGGLGADWRLGSGSGTTVLTADVRHQSFSSQKVTTLSPGIVQYLANGRLWFTARASVLVAQREALRVGWLVRADYLPADGYRLFGGLADGPDTELGIVSQVTSAFGGAEIPLGERFFLNLSGGREWREMGADRTDLRVGFRVGL